jgi:hypothetical protein
MVRIGAFLKKRANMQSSSRIVFFIVFSIFWGWVLPPAFFKSQKIINCGGLSMIQNSAVCLSKATQERLRTYCQIQNKQQKEVVEMAIEMLLSGEKGDEYEKNKRK